MTTFGISELDISYFKHFHHSLSQSDVVSAIDNGIIVTTWRSFSSKSYSLYFLSTKNAFQCCPHWKQRVQLSTLHTEVRSYILPNYLWDMVWLRFGRKDHMTRHAKKTHANFYDSSERLERTRLISTPLPGGSLLFSFCHFCSLPVTFVLFLHKQNK